MNVYVLRYMWQYMCVLYVVVCMSVCVVCDICVWVMCEYVYALDVCVVCSVVWCMCVLYMCVVWCLCVCVWCVLFVFVFSFKFSTSHMLTMFLTYELVF